jgi:hypothetical protein
MRPRRPSCQRGGTGFARLDLLLAIPRIAKSRGRRRGPRARALVLEMKPGSNSRPPSSSTT